jgi:hypothetical protein
MRGAVRKGMDVQNVKQSSLLNNERQREALRSTTYLRTLLGSEWLKTIPIASRLLQATQPGTAVN